MYACTIIQLQLTHCHNNNYVTYHCPCMHGLSNTVNLNSWELIIHCMCVLNNILFFLQAYFIIPVAVFAILSSVFLVVLPILQKPAPTLLALGTTLLGIPFYVFLVMETPYRLRPKILDRISSKLLTVVAFW